jgi:short-subunit dehydrogenase
VLDAVLITGATDGIGLEMARRYRGRVRQLILVGRRERAQLSDPVFTSSLYCKVELAKAHAASQIADFLDAHRIESLDLVIHNAGTGYYGNTASQSALNIDQIFDVNLRTPIALTQRLIPHVQAARGKFVFVSSLASFLPCPDYAVYAATKAALDEFARNLRIELATTASVLVVHPGATRTGIHEKLGMDPKVTTNFASPAAVVDEILWAIGGRRRSYTIGWKNRWVGWLAWYGARPLDAILRWRRICAR